MWSPPFSAWLPVNHDVLQPTSDAVDALVQREQTRRDVEEEFQFHIDTQVEDLVRQGLPEAEAQRRTHVQMGRTDLQAEKYRDAIGLGIWDEIGRDLTHGLRSLFRNPGLSCVAVLSLAIGSAGRLPCSH